MRVLVNGRALIGKKTGIGHYTNEVLRTLAPLTGPDSLHLFLPRWAQRGAAYRSSQSTGRETAPLVRQAAKPNSWRAALNRWISRVGDSVYHAHFRYTSRQGFDLYHEPNFLPIHCDLPVVVTVHDLSVFLHPEWHPAERVARHQRDFLAGIARASHVLTISDNARHEIIRTLGLPADRVTRTYMGVREGLRPLPTAEVAQRLRELGLPERYLLYVGTIEPRKNVLNLMRAYCMLPVTTRLRYPLLIVGARGWNSDEVYRYLEDEARHRGVQILGYLPEADLGVLYNGARALVFPSRYEGFGMPPMEMMACGGAVIASTAGAIAETVGRRACLLDPDDLEGWRDAMERVCEDDDWWTSLRHEITDLVRPYTWENCAAGTLAVYHQVLSGGKGKTADRRAA